MKVVYITHYSGNGGANRELVLLVREMLKRGNIPYVVMPKQGWLYETLKDECECVVVRYHRWVEECADRYIILRQLVKWLINWKAVFYLKSFFKNKDIRIIHTNDSYTVIGAYLANMIGVPHVWQMREIFDDQFGHIHTYREQYCSKWLKRAKYIIAISNAVKKRYQKYNDLNIVQIYDAIPAPSIQKKRKIGRKLELLFCGGTSVHKGFDDVLELAKRLQCEGVDFRIRIVASSSIDQTLKQDMMNTGIYDKMEFLGFVDNLEEIRQESDIMLMCSKSEAFGLVTVEAMLSGVLVIGKNSGATPELIRNGETGFLYNNIDELVECVRRAAQINDDYIIENARKYAQENFTVKSIVNKIERLYKEALK